MNVNNNFWETMVTDPFNEPLLIRTNAYTNNTKGTITIGSNNNIGYTVMCVPVTGSTQKYTVSVKNTDVAAMETKGATRGLCTGAAGSGRIYYTTFHNEHNGQISSDVKNILQYVILNL